MKSIPKLCCWGTRVHDVIVTSVLVSNSDLFNTVAPVIPLLRLEFGCSGPLAFFIFVEHNSMEGGGSGEGGHWNVPFWARKTRRILNERFEFVINEAVDSDFECEWSKSDTRPGVFQRHGVASLHLWCHRVGSRISVHSLENHLQYVRWIRRQWAGDRALIRDKWVLGNPLLADFLHV